MKREAATESSGWEDSRASPSALATVVAVQNLTREFGDKRVLANVTLDLQPGERLAIRGPNGAGKTTLLRCILGTLLPTAGTVTIGGHAAGSHAARCLTAGSLAQERSFYLRLTGRENLLLFARLRGLTRSSARRCVDGIVEELEAGNIAAKRADRCSTGQLQQLALARVLLGTPALVLLDEPTRSLDAPARARLWAALSRRSDLTVLFATHLEEDLAHATRTLNLGTPA